MGLVYLIQPAQCNGLSRYKIGHSRKDTMDRLKQYPAQSRVVCVMGLIPNPQEVERALIEAFRQHFKPATCGTEYFEGDIDNMRYYFDEVVKNTRVSDRESPFVGIVNSKISLQKIAENRSFEFLVSKNPNNPKNRGLTVEGNIVNPYNFPRDGSPILPRARVVDDTRYV